LAARGGCTGFDDGFAARGGFGFRAAGLAAGFRAGGGGGEGDGDRGG